MCSLLILEKVSNASKINCFYKFRIVLCSVHVIGIDSVGLLCRDFVVIARDRHFRIISDLISYEIVCVLMRGRLMEAFNYTRPTDDDDDVTLSDFVFH